jgi:hypothetical protein
MLRTSVHAACESLAVGGQCKSPIWQGAQERGARTSRSGRWTSLPSAIRSDTAGPAKPASRPVPSVRNRPLRTSRIPRTTTTRRNAQKPGARSWQPRRPTAVGVPSGHTETHGQRTAPRPTSAIAASGQLPEDWPSSGQVHRRLATCARSLQEAPARESRTQPAHSVGACHCSGESAARSAARSARSSRAKRRTSIAGRLANARGSTRKPAAERIAKPGAPARRRVEDRVFLVSAPASTESQFPGCRSECCDGVLACRRRPP